MIIELVKGNIRPTNIIYKNNAKSINIKIELIIGFDKDNRIELIKSISNRDKLSENIYYKLVIVV